jgi:hypothetical protein
MKKTFSEKYKDYCRARDARDGIFIITQGTNEYLEEFEERFQLIYKRYYNCTLDEDSLKLVLLKGAKEDIIETLNLFSNGDIYHMDYDDIKQIFKNNFISSRKKDKNGKWMVSQSSNPAIHTKNDIGGLLEDMKTNILHSLAM